MVRRESQFGWTTTWAPLLWLVLGLPWLEPAGRPFRHHHYRLGVGLRGATTLDVSSYRRDAARCRVQKQLTAVSLALDRYLARQRLHHPDSVDVPVVRPLAGLAGRIDRERHIGKRVSALTCAGEARLPAPPTPPACRPA